MGMLRPWALCAAGKERVVNEIFILNHNIQLSTSRREDASKYAVAGEVAGSAGIDVAIVAAAVVALGTGNHVLYKLALVPLREYPFFPTQFATN
ncbi:hypothetical protein GUJ93_ZPchr0013g37160 [Zizania palustris]|uniref:Uncharacterized protein n=1 Tax=Zizania palustris TaxID=103762 RepID=A0A8J5X0B5_ZIZPA|nr:hypothetical protein GUJ93_ZPchr0013g37160 [Zizania palustris]